MREAELEAQRARTSEVTASVAEIQRRLRTLPDDLLLIHPHETSATTIGTIATTPTTTAAAASAAAAAAAADSPKAALTPHDTSTQYQHRSHGTANPLALYNAHGSRPPSSVTSLTSPPSAASSYNPLSPRHQHHQHHVHFVESDRNDPYASVAGAGAYTGRSISGQYGGGDGSGGSYPRHSHHSPSERRSSIIPPRSPTTPKP